VQNARTWWIITPVVSLLVLAMGWLLLVSPKHGEAADLQDQTATVNNQNQASQVQLDALRAQAKKLPEQKAELARLQVQIPPTPQLPALIRSISAASKASGMTLTGLTPSAPTAVVTATAAAAAPTTPGVALVGLQQIPIAMTATGTFSAARRFLGTLEMLPRTFLVSGLQMGRGTTGGQSVTVTITGAVFMNTPGTTGSTATGTTGTASGKAPATSTVPSSPAN